MGAGRPTIILPVSQLITTILQRHLLLILSGRSEHKKRNKTENHKIDNQQRKVLRSLYTHRGILMGVESPTIIPCLKLHFDVTCFSQSTKKQNITTTLITENSTSISLTSHTLTPDTENKKLKVNHDVDNWKLKVLRSLYTHRGFPLLPFVNVLTYNSL